MVSDLVTHHRLMMLLSTKKVQIMPWYLCNSSYPYSELSIPPRLGMNFFMSQIRKLRPKRNVRVVVGAFLIVFGGQIS